MQNSKTVKFWDDYYASLESNDNDAVTYDMAMAAAEVENKLEVVRSTETNKTELHEVDIDGTEGQGCRKCRSSTGISNDIEKEWIVQPNASLFELLKRHFRDNDLESPLITEELSHRKKYQMLEIGCGVSKFAKDFFTFLNGITGSELTSEFSYGVTATDVSQVCIEQMSRRDEQLIRSSKGSFSYRVLDILSEAEVLSITTNQGTFDVILDKGCMDTFLFRSAHNLRPILAQKCLDNIHRLLSPGGKNIIMSPRRTIKYVTDYNGFTSVKRISLTNESGILAADLDGRQAAGANNDEAKGGLVRPKAFLFVCMKNDNYQPGKNIPFKEDSRKAKDSTTCPKCGMNFHDFLLINNGPHTKMNNIQCNNNALLRKWKGHCTHCQGPK